VKSTTTDGERITELLRKFDAYAKATYPRTPRRITGSSGELQFVASELNYDLVPMLATAWADYQLLLKRDGSRRLTSVTKHTEFVRSRTSQSDALSGRVKFNECVRLLKWWRFVRIDAASSIEEVRTTLIELLCASAYDRPSVATTYTETLLRWLSWLAAVTSQRMRISFNDYASIEPFDQKAQGNPLWQVIDPATRTTTSSTRSGATSSWKNWRPGSPTVGMPCRAWSPMKGRATTARSMTSCPIFLGILFSFTEIFHERRPDRNEEWHLH
jgi:hypothetical protein